MNKVFIWILIISFSLLFTKISSANNSNYGFFQKPVKEKIKDKDPVKEKNKDKDEDKERFKIQMTSAWVRYIDEDYYGALRIYRKLYENNKEHSTLNFRMGKCFIELNEMDTALTHLKMAYKQNPPVSNEIHFLFGKAYQYLGDLQSAINSYYNYKATLSPRQNERHAVNILLRQCSIAKELMESPVNVQINNLGKNVNTKYTDACPSISADAKTLIFTSRRPENIGGKIDIFTEEYYDDVYISNWNAEKKEWSVAENIGAPINTEAHNANMSITPDGNKIFIYKNVIGETKSGDIYISEKTPTGEWGVPKAFANENKYINTTYFESSACLSSDGKTLYFVSEREKEGFGHGDIYVSHKEGREWTKPVNLGPIINTEGDEIGVYIHPDNKTLFFSSNGHNTMGGHDIFMSLLSNDGKWSEPINMGYPINTTQEEIHFVFTADRQMAYLSSSRNEGHGKMDVYAVNMAYYFKNNTQIDENMASTITGPPLAILKGSVVDGESSEALVANLLIKDLSNNKTKITSSNKNGDYFITLPADRKYEITVKNKNYKSLVVKFKLPKNDGEIPTMVKHLFLNKK